jgi:hypothetical protein
VTKPVPGQPRYDRTPEVMTVKAATIGGTVSATNSVVIRNEVLGRSLGIPAQRFPLQHRPVIPGDTPRVLEVGTTEVWEEWTEVTSFADSDERSRHFMVDAIGGAVVLGPAVRLEYGDLRH